MDRSVDKDVLDIVKRAQMDTLLDVDEVEGIESNKEYLRAVKTLYLDILNKAKFLSHNFSDMRLEEEVKEVSEKIDELEKKKRDEDGFACDSFFEEHCSDESEEHIVKMLYSKTGVGLRVFEPCVSGEVLMIALKLTMDMDVEEGRKYLLESSSLRKKNIIKPVERRSKSLSSRRRKKMKSIESQAFQLNDWIIDKLQGHVDTDDMKRVEKKREKKKAEMDVLEKVESDVGFSDVVLPEGMKNTILSFLEQSRNKDKFMDEWNMKSIAGDREGVNILFSGPSGTGKTMLSKAIANELDREVYMVSFSDLVDCYHGNTESNVKKIFDSVEEDSIVLMDEAEAILHRRGPAKDSVDKSENRVVNIVLQEMERHAGMIIFTTNIAIGLDRAIKRRLDLKLELPEPNVEAREKIWDYHIPDEMPLGEDVDVGEFAEEFDFTGGQIRNVVLNAGRIAMRDGEESVTKENFLEACNKELEGSEAMDYVIGKEEVEEEEEVKGYA